MISSNQISAHSTDTAALAACVNAASCYGVSYLSTNSESTRWSARLGGAGVTTFTLSGVNSWVYSGSCERRLQEEEQSFFRRLADQISSVPDDRLPVSAGVMASVPDLDEKPVSIKPAHGPLITERDLRL